MAVSRTLIFAPIFVSVALAVNSAIAEPPARHREDAARPAVAEHTRPLSSLLWHAVVSPDGSYGGGVSDVLVDMPTGRILYVVVDRNDPDHYSKAIAPDSLTRSSDGNYRCSLSLSQWLTAPIVDGTGTRVERFAHGHWDILGYAEAAWAPVAARRTRGLEVVAPAAGQSRAVPFVSVQRLREMNIDSIGGDQVGSIAGYLIDWSRHRVTHVLMALPHSVAPAYAIPILRLMPRIGEGEALFVNIEPSALRQGSVADLGSDVWSRFPERIFRYRAPSAVASNH